MQRVSIGMEIFRPLRNAWTKLLAARHASRVAAAAQAAARDLARKQLLVQQLTEGLRTGRGRPQKRR
jgi:hypothetical protein